MKHKRNESGAHHILALLIIVIVLAVGFAGYRVFSKNKPGGSTDTTVSESDALADFKFTRLPFDVEDIGSVAPVGEFAGITRETAPNSHYAGNYRHYVFSKEPGVRDYNVYAPSDAKITAFRYSDFTGQYRFNFEVGSAPGVFYFLDHIQSLSAEIEEKLKQAFGGEIPVTSGVEQIPQSISVKAGDVLGKTGLKGIAWDWGLMDPNNCDGITKKDHYHQDMCPLSVYDYLPTDLQEQIKPLAGYWSDPSKGGDGVRKVVNGPTLGKYGHDKAGTLSGAWFQKPKGWENAFFVPDPYVTDGLQIRLAIPELSVFGVWTGIKINDGSNNPDPLKVTPDSGIVAYVLSKNSARDNSEYGVLLVKVNSDESITLETLANTSQVPANPSFTASAVTIKR